jgi:hypothetical protein
MVSPIRILAALTALVAVIPLAALAQTAAPATPDSPPPPTYAAPPPSYSSTDEVIHGRVSSFDGAYSLQVNDDRGYIDNVKLRQGTVINPTGIRLAAGMAVTIHGVNRGSVFAANVIDTPYQTYGAVYPYGAYPYPVYPYPAFGYPFYPTVRFGFGFGFGGYGGGYRRW